MCELLSSAAYADKRGGGTSFLFGRKTWKKRYFVIDPEENSLAYWESSSHQVSWVQRLTGTLCCHCVRLCRLTLLTYRASAVVVARGAEIQRATVEAAAVFGRSQR
jgi:hypothetical protein